MMWLDLFRIRLEEEMRLLVNLLLTMDLFVSVILHMGMLVDLSPCNHTIVAAVKNGSVGIAIIVILNVKLRSEILVGIAICLKPEARA